MRERNLELCGSSEESEGRKEGRAAGGGNSGRLKLENLFRDGLPDTL